MKTTSAFILILFLIQSCTKDHTQPVQLSSCDSLNVTYNQVIKPMIIANCSTSGCHAPGTGVSGDYTNYSGLKAHVDNGIFKIRAIDARDMPPNGPLTAIDIQKINCWLEQNAPNN